jgi:hypothetical protein
MTLQNAPPGLDYDRDRKFSKVALVLLANYWLVNVFLLCFTDPTCLRKLFQLRAD